MNKYLFLLLIISTALPALAQKPATAVKIYSNFYLGDRGRGEPNLYLERFDNTSYKGTTIAWFSNNPEKRYTREFEIGMRVRTREVPFDGTTFSIKDIEAATRFELGARLKPKLFNHVAFSINTAFDLYYYQGEAVPESALSFRRNNQEGGVLISFIPHIEIPITNRVFIDLNINFINISFGINYLRVENPALTEEEQKTSGFDFDTQGERSLRIGLGYYLNTAAE